MFSIEFIQSIDWPKYGDPRRMRAIATHIHSTRSRHAGYWTEVSAVFPDGRGLERPGQGLPAIRPGQLQGQVAGVLLLAEGLHLRLSHRDRRVRQARQGVQGA